MTETETLLAALRPIRPPPDAGEGALLALALVGAALGFAAAAYAANWLRRRRARGLAAAALLAAARGLAPQERLAAQAKLARSLARERDPSSPPLSGEAQLRKLDALFGVSFFAQGPGRALGEALYRPEPQKPETLDAIDRELSRLAAAPVKGLRR